MKSQAGIEFLIYLSIIIILLDVFLYSSFSTNYQLISRKVESELEEIASAAVFELNSAVRGGDGYERRFNMKEYSPTIREFNITIHGNIIEVEANNKHYYAFAATNNINGNFTKEWNIIRNVDGVIYVN
ncbi:MAG: hypothetical protein QXM38_00400 [Candidatus Aenigmatarchaeota archaeon]